MQDHITATRKKALEQQSGESSAALKRMRVGSLPLEVHDWNIHCLCRCQRKTVPIELTAFFLPPLPAARTGRTDCTPLGDGCGAAVTGRSGKDRAAAPVCRRGHARGGMRRVLPRTVGLFVACSARNGVVLHGESCSLDAYQQVLSSMRAAYTSTPIRVLVAGVL